MGDWSHYICKDLYGLDFANCKKRYKSLLHHYEKTDKTFKSLPSTQKREILKLMVREGKSYREAYNLVVPKPSEEYIADIEVSNTHPKVGEKVNVLVKVVRGNAEGREVILYKYPKVVIGRGKITSGVEYFVKSFDSDTTIYATVGGKETIGRVGITVVKEPREEWISLSVPEKFREVKRGERIGVTVSAPAGSNVRLFDVKPIVDKKLAEGKTDSNGLAKFIIRVDKDMTLQADLGAGKKESNTINIRMIEEEKPPEEEQPPEEKPLEEEQPSGVVSGCDEMTPTSIGVDKKFAKPMQPIKVFVKGTPNCDVRIRHVRRARPDETLAEGKTDETGCYTTTVSFGKEDTHEIFGEVKDRLLKLSWGDSTKTQSIFITVGKGEEEEGGVFDSLSGLLGVSPRTIKAVLVILVIIIVLPSIIGLIRSFTPFGALGRFGGR